MNWEYLHLVTHSFPIVLSLTGALVGIAGWVARRPEFERWGVVALLVGGAFAIPAYLTGLAAADIVAERTFVEPSIVQSHRYAATFALMPLILGAVLAGFSLYEREDARLRRFVLVVAAIAAAVTGYAAYVGSRIEHGGEGKPGGEPVGAKAGATALAGLLLLAGAGSGSAGRPRARGEPGERGDDGSSGDQRATSSSDDPNEERGRRLHREALVVDGHNDLPWRYRKTWGLDLSRADLATRLPDGHTDLVRLREGGVDVQFWAAYVPAHHGGPEATAMAFEQIDLIQRLAARYPDYLELAYASDDIPRIVAAGRTASMIGVEGGHAIADSLPVLRQLYRAGARYLTLTHTGTLRWIDAAGDEPRHGGLAEFGREVVCEMNRLGMLVDISHVTEAAMRDVLEVSRAPVIFSHSNARALANHVRNVPDDVVRRLAENRGLIMVNFYSGFLVEEGARMVRDMFADERRLRRENPDPRALREAAKQWLRDHPTPPGSVGDIADHIEYLAGLAGVDHVGIGSDFDGVPMVPEGMEDVSKLPALTVELLRRGHPEAEVRKILGENFLRVLREVEGVAEDLRATEAPSHAHLDPPARSRVEPPPPARSNALPGTQAEGGA